jgi:glycosyltransferase involved in cell wall biosynthesis
MGRVARPVIILSEPTVSSYGVVGALYHNTFRAMGIDSTLLPYPTDGAPRMPRGAIVLHNTLGFRFAPLSGVINVAVPFHEWSRYPPQWAARLDRFDQVWAASTFLARVLRKSGVNAPVRFAPPALDRDPPHAKQSWAARRPFRFLFVGEPHFRKGHHLLIEGFRRLVGTGNAATLTIKTSPDCPWAVNDRGIRVIAERWPHRRLWRLYATHDAFVSASLGEGLGLGVVEAIMAWLPVAANCWGGHTSLLLPGGYVRVPHRVVPQPYCSRPDFFAPGQQCALSSPGAVAAAMAAMMGLSARVRQVQAMNARAHLTERFGVSASSARIAAAVKRLGRSFN